MGKASNQTKPKAAAKPAKAKTETQCRALEIGHRSCKCGGKYCQPAEPAE
jgi:hypothetical protein